MGKINGEFKWQYKIWYYILFNVDLDDARVKLGKQVENLKPVDSLAWENTSEASHTLEGQPNPMEMINMDFSH